MRSGCSVADAMTNKPVCCSERVSVQKAARLMHEHEVGSLIVMENQKLLGIVTEEDLVYKVMTKALDVKKTMVRDVMSTDLVTIGPRVDIIDAMKLMSKESVGRLPVLENGEVVGFITWRTIIKIEPDLIELLAERFELRGIHEDSALLDDFRGELKKKRCSECGHYATNLIRRGDELVCGNCLL